MTTKKWIRILSVFLCLLLSVQCCTFVASAEETEVTMLEKNEEVNENPIICEVTEMRNATTKYFLHKDRKTITVANYPNKLKS